MRRRRLIVAVFALAGVGGTLFFSRLNPRQTLPPELPRDSPPAVEAPEPPGTAWAQWRNSDEARPMDGRVKSALAHAIAVWTARGVAPEAFRILRAAHGKHDSGRTCYPFERQHGPGRAADVWVGDLNGDGRSDLIDFCLFATTLDSVRGGCGIFGWQTDEETSTLWLHVDASGRPERWGAWHPQHGSVQHVVWSRRARSVQARCRAWGLKATRRTMKLVVDKQPSTLVFDPQGQSFATQPSLRVYVSGRLVKIYPVALGLDPVRDKEKRDDYRTPEGDFYTCGKNPRSSFHKSLRLSYPNAEDAARGLKAKLIDEAIYRAITKAIRERRAPPRDTRLGGDIMLHGGGAQGAWTWGCAALNNEDMDELFDFVPNGIPVKVLPVAK